MYLQNLPQQVELPPSSSQNQEHVILILLANIWAIVVHMPNLIMTMLSKLKWCLLQKGYQQYCALRTAVPVCLSPDIA